MKTALSIWLSIVLLTTGLPMPGMAGNARTEPQAVQEEAGIQEKEEPERIEGENGAPDSGPTAPEETGGPEEIAPGQETETLGQESGEKQEKTPDPKEKEEEEEKQETKEDEKAQKESRAGKGEENPEPEAPESGGAEKAGDKEPGNGGETQELAATDRQASSIATTEIKQDTDKKKLVLEKGEALSFLEEAGYHLEVSRKVKCTHTADSISASIKCKKAANPLNPTKTELKNNVELTGKLKGKKTTKSIVADDKGGTQNTVTHWRLEVEIPGICSELLAGPYVCGDGYAAYAYFEKHYSYCPNTEKFYKVGESHVWLGCTRGDAGVEEFHSDPYAHEFQVFKYVPNKYTVTYDKNGGEGTAKDQNATYDKPLTLNNGKKVSREGYTLTGWNTKKNGKGTAYSLGQDTTNLTTEDGGKVTLYAQWTPNTLTVRYDANGGEINRANASQDISTFTHTWSYGKSKQDPANFGTFGLSRTGHSRKDGAEWNTKADGTGKSYDQDIEYELTDYAPNLKTGSREITLYAQWEPNVYTVTLDNQLTDPDKTGTGKIYKKYSQGLFLDSTCSQKFSSKAPIILPQKEGHQFTGYYDSNGKLMVDANGNPTTEATSRIYKTGNETWLARYDYLVGCTDYADIPCDMEKAGGDNREDPGVQITYDSSTRKVTAQTGQAGCTVTLTGQPSGTEIGEFESSLGAGSASGNTGTSRIAEIALAVPEGTAYRLSVTKGGKLICDRLAYYKDGRFRTLVKLGEQEAKSVPQGGSIAGSAWGTDSAAYDLYGYHGCSDLKDVKEPGSVCRYFRYKEVNMAYSGDGATAGKNTLEYDVSLEDMYQFRDNGFTKERTETKYTEDEEPYECKVRYSFQGWKMSKEYLYQEKEQKGTNKVYSEAKEVGTISERTTEDISTYQTAEPIHALPGLGTVGMAGEARGAQGTWEEALKAAAPGKAHAAEYINLTAVWDSYPTITVTPGKKLEFYEGEEVAKEDLINCLTAHDNEDNRNIKINPNLNDKLRIVKIIYPEPENRSQAAYEETYEEDVPDGFLLDTYYLKLEEDETVDVLATFAVTDSAGNTTEEEIPVKVKYNHYPEISSEDAFYYLKEEANRGDITESALLGRASAEDEEDGDITVKLLLKDFDAQEIKMQTEAKAEFSVTYQVTDAYRKTTYKTVKLMVWDGDAAAAEMPKYYVRYISEKYLDTLEENSTWREPENMAYLKGILGNETPMETWEFTHADVLDVQGWITEGGEGNWKTGQEANREFLTKFAHCRQ